MDRVPKLANDAMHVELIRGYDVSVAIIDMYDAKWCVMINFWDFTYCIFVV